jgi:Fe-S-cluster containining protein
MLERAYPRNGFDNEGIQMCCPEKPRPVPIECNRCGECCKKFTLPWSPEKLEANRLAAQRGDSQFQYQDENSIVQSDQINPMLAIWSSYLVSVAPPEPVGAQRGASAFGLYWYSCYHLEKDKKGKLFCAIHDHRPYVCSKFMPDFQGGYIHTAEQIIYPECSYKQDWPDELKGQQKVSGEISGQEALDIANRKPGAYYQEATPK